MHKLSSRQLLPGSMAIGVDPGCMSVHHRSKYYVLWQKTINNLHFVFGHCLVRLW
jgi:hypothetical protein